MKTRDQSGWAPEAPEEQELPGAGAAGKADSSSFPELGRRLVSEAQAYAATEMERQKIRAIIVGNGARDTAVLVLVALFLLFGAMTALVVGCVWMLAPLVGVAGALAITILGALFIVALLLLAARARMRRALGMAFGGDETA